MFVLEREVRFQEVDAAGLLFFPTFLVICHEAMESWCGALVGGYPHLITTRRIGLPTVQLETRFLSPLRHGDRVEVQLACTRLGQRSLGLRYRFEHPGASAPRLCAEVQQVVVTTDLDAMASCPMPDDLRALAQQTLAAEAT